MLWGYKNPTKGRCRTTKAKMIFNFARTSKRTQNEPSSAPIFCDENGFGPKQGIHYRPADLNRLNARFKVFMEPFKADFAGVRVLDLASHDGRWSYAALSLGAAHVTGIEARPELIEKGKHLFARDDLRKRVEFLVGDIFDAMPRLLERGEQFDVVLCLGIFYHVMDHFRLLKLIHDFKPKLVIVDSGMINNEKPFISLRTERSDHFLNAIPVGTQPESVIGFVSTGGFKMMARSLGFDVEFLDWNPAKFDNHANLHDYFKEGGDKARRFSAVLRQAR